MAIEQNSLSLEQVTALFDGERVIGLARDIQEVRNAINAYDAMPSWDPANPQHLLEAHGLLMAGLIDGPGCFRSGGVGIYRGDQLVHMAPPAARIPVLVADLLALLAASTWHPLLVSCVAHYELEFIHPFADGNGRLGRLWQTLILSRWNPLLAWLPIEEVIRSRQQGYYESLGQADQQGDLQPFVAYQLEAIHDSLRSEISSEIGSEIGVKAGAAIDALILRDLAIEPTLSARSLAKRQQLSQRAVEKHLAGSLANARGIVKGVKSIRNQFQLNLSVFDVPPAEIQSMPHQRLFH
ncbi:Fic family protein [Synechococcus lacustris]|uniref:Fic family protein n=1 Tax=Synechococcus lacustris TaxID=2116544 RepID=UPI003340B9BC